MIHSSRKYSYEIVMEIILWWVDHHNMNFFKRPQHEEGGEAPLCGESLHVNF